MHPTAPQISENDWRQDAPATLETAKTSLEILKPIYPDAKLNFVQSYIALVVNGNNYITFRKRDAGKSEIRFWFTASRIPAASKLLEDESVQYKSKRNQHLSFNSDSKDLTVHSGLFLRLAQLSKESWEDV